MADTWVVDYTLVKMAPGKSLMSLWNGASSSKVIRIYRVFASNSNFIANTSVSSNLEMQRISAHSGGITYTPVTRDTANAALDANVVCSTGATVTINGRLRTWQWCTQLPTASGREYYTYTMVYPMTCLWDVGYGSSKLQPLTIRAGEGISILNKGMSAVGLIDFWVEFTQAAS